MSKSKHTTQIYENRIICYHEWPGTPEDGQAAGYDGPGWYFWDGEEYCHGPFVTKEKAESALALYEP